MSIKTIKRKRFAIRQSKRKFLHEQERKIIRKKIKYNNLPAYFKKKRNTNFLKNTQSVKHQTIKITETFSLLTNTDKTINHFNSIKDNLIKNIPVYLDISEVSIMGPETLTYLCAFINEPTITHRTALKGNIPINNELKEMFNRSGFFSHVHPYNSQNNVSNDIHGELIHQITRKQVESELAAEVIKSAIKHTFNSDDITNQKVYPILIECMANTLNHAHYGQKEKIYNWWLLAYKEQETRVTKFCFLDLGVGIFGSLEQKFKENKLAELINWFVPSKNKTTLTKIFQRGERITSTVHLSGRGQGLNYIYRLVKEDRSIKNFTLISNDILARIGYNKPDEILKLHENFDGTMYYWELIPENENI